MRLGLLSVAILMFLGGWGSQSAFAQQAAIGEAEPQRFALVIGNAAYSGDLVQLGSPCRNDPRDPGVSSPQDPPGDAEVMVDALRDAGWNDIEKACNLTRSELRDKIDAFVDKVAQTERAFGVIYFSGHGAQVHERNYLFGIDATIDAQREVNAFKQNADARLFGSGAVELEGALGRLNPFYGKGLVVIIDACRNNPLIEDLRKTPMRAVSYPTRVQMLDGIVLSFATMKGAAAPDGGFQKVSPFTRVLAEKIRQLANSSNIRIEDLIAQANTAVEIATRGDQKPRRVGELRQPPVFCLKGCPSKLVDWQTANDVLGSDLSAVSDLPRPPAPVKLAALAAPALPTKGTILRPHRLFVRLAQTSVPQSVYERVIRQSKTAPPRAMVQAVDDYTRQFAVDVYWCSGDSRSDARQSKALALKAALERQFATKSPVIGFRLGTVRALALSPSLASQQRLSDRRILIDQDSAMERRWAQAVQSAATETFAIQERKAGSSPDRISVFVCDGFDFTGAVDAVYFHARPGVPEANIFTLKQGLNKSVAGLNVAIETEQVEQSPNLTQVRYFRELQKDKADRIAQFLQAALGHPVEARFFPEYQEQLGTKGVIEVWIGLQEPPLMG